MKLTLTIEGRVRRDEVARAREEAIAIARLHVIEAKRGITERGRCSAYVDKHFISPLEGRTDVRSVRSISDDCSIEAK
jgi:hypothetical protein